MLSDVEFNYPQGPLVNQDEDEVTWDESDIESPKDQFEINQETVKKFFNDELSEAEEEKVRKALKQALKPKKT